jgi:excisionase family DNA binding protein
LRNENEPLTLAVPEAGRRYLGLSRNSSYAAAERGEIPTIRVGRLLRVPVRAMERLLDQAALRAASSKEGGAE